MDTGYIALVCTGGFAALAALAFLVLWLMECEKESDPEDWSARFEIRKAPDDFEYYREDACEDKVEPKEDE